MTASTNDANKACIAWGAVSYEPVEIAGLGFRYRYIDHGGVSIQAYKGVSGSVTASELVSVTAWGDVTGAVTTVGAEGGQAGSITIFDSGTLAGNVTAGGGIQIDSWGNVTGTVTGGNDVAATVPAGQSTPPGPSTVSVTTQGNVSGAVTSSNDVVISALGNVAGAVTATNGVRKLLR